MTILATTSCEKTKDLKFEDLEVGEAFTVHGESRSAPRIKVSADYYLLYHSTGYVEPLRESLLRSLTLQRTSVTIEEKSV